MARLKEMFRRFFRSVLFLRDGTEPLMYRVHLFNELLNLKNEVGWIGKRVLEIGPKDGLDSRRLASLKPSELVMIDLPEKSDHIKSVVGDIDCRWRYVEGNIMYLDAKTFDSLGKFDLIWCTGVLYHNAEQLRFLRKLYKILNAEGYLVLESATIRRPRSLRNGPYVQIHYPHTYRNTGTITHLPTAKAINAWLSMVGFREIRGSLCYEIDNRNLKGQRYACICKKTAEDEADVYYARSGMNPAYRFGDSA